MVTPKASIDRFEVKGVRNNLALLVWERKVYGKLSAKPHQCFI